MGKTGDLFKKIRDSQGTFHAKMGTIKDRKVMDLTETEENNRVEKTRDLFKKIKRYQGNISWKDGHNKGQKWYGPNRSRRYQEEVARTHRRTILKRSS